MVILLSCWWRKPGQWRYRDDPQELPLPTHRPLGGGIAVMFKSTLTPFLCMLCHSACLSWWNCSYPVTTHLSRSFAYIARTSLYPASKTNRQTKYLLLFFFFFFGGGRISSTCFRIMIIIIIKEFIKPGILSIKTILSARARTHVRTPVMHAETGQRASEVMSWTGSSCTRTPAVFFSRLQRTLLCLTTVPSTVALLSNGPLHGNGWLHRVTLLTSGWHEELRGDSRRQVCRRWLLDVYNTGLRQELDRHAPLTTRHVSDRPSAPWTTDDKNDEVSYTRAS